MVASPLCRTLAAAVLLLCAAPAFADYVVNTDADEDVDGDGTCSLREAITAVNHQASYHDCTSANAGESLISVAIPPNQGETHVIALTAALPRITHFIGIDATAQSGTTCTPAPNLRVQVTNPAQLAIDGLFFDAGSDFSSLKGLAFSGFSATQQAGIYIAGNDVQVGCVIAGTDPAGTSAEPNYYGIYVNGQSAQIGVATADEWLPNLISGNSMVNVYVDAGGADSVVSGNYIGVDHSGLAPLASPFGLYANDVSGLGIGYVSAKAPAERQRNIIGIAAPQSTTAVGVEFDHAIDNVAAGNYIGVGADGHTALPIGTGLEVVMLGGKSTLLGCDGVMSEVDCRNVIANPTGSAVENFEGSTATAIVGNYLGIAADGVTVLAATVYAVGITLAGADALVARNAISTGGAGTAILLSPGSSNQTPLFSNGAMAGSDGATLDSSDNCVSGNGAGVDTRTASNPTVPPTDFWNNWWGAANGPAPSGSGDSVSANVVFWPYLDAPSPYCGAIAGDIFASGFD
jgi:CSLREA domain-containing protein